MKSNFNKLNRHVTLKDIAQSTGYTVNTVSHALNDKDDISETTKQIIRQKADELGYIKNSSASYLRTKKTKTIAVIVGDISNPFFGILVKEIEVYARQRDYNTFIINTEEDASLEEIAIRSVLEKNVDGIILCPNQKKSNSVQLLIKLGFPFVLIGRYFENLPSDYVIADDKKGGYIATKYLIEKGNTKILFLNGPDYISSAALRLQGYKNALADHQIPFDPSLVKEISITGNFTYLLKQLPHLNFTAVLAFSDIVAWEIIHALRQPEFSGVKNIEVVGFDNIQSKMLIPYPLTSVNYDKQKMAHLAVEILLNRLDNSANPNRINISLDTELIIR